MENQNSDMVLFHEDVAHLDRLGPVARQKIPCEMRGFFDLLRQEERREQANIPESLSGRSDPGRG